MPMPEPKPNLTPQVTKDLRRARGEDDRVSKILLLTLTLTLTLALAPTL